MPQKRMECFRLLFHHLVWIEHQFLSGIRDSTKARSLWWMMRGAGWVRKSIDQSWLAKGLGFGLGLLCCGFKGVQEEIPWEEASALEIGSVAFLQDNAPVTEYLTKMGIKTVSQPPYSSELSPCDFWLFLSSEAVVIRQLRWKRLWRRSLTHSHKMNSMESFRCC